MGTWFDNGSNASGYSSGGTVLHTIEVHNAIRFAHMVDNRQYCFRWI